MRIPFLFLRDNTECSAGTQYYTCASSGFKGCCAVDACDYDGGCPDGASTGSSTTSKNTAASKSTSTSESKFITSPTTSSTTATSTPATSPSATHTTSSSSKTTTTSSSPSNTATTTSAGSSPAKETGLSDNNQSSSHHLSKGAIGGIVTAGVIAFVILFCLFLWKMRRRNKQLEEMANAALSGASNQQSPGPGGSTFPEPTPSPANPLGSPGLDEKLAAANISQREGLLANDANATVNAKLAELQGTSPASTTVPLFGEAFNGNMDEAVQRWGLYGARMMAQNKAMTDEERRRAQSPDTIADYGGNYMGPGSETGMMPQPLQVGRVVELDAERQQVVAELETPQQTPLPTPMSTPGIGSYSPSLSVGSSHVGRSTVVSSWRSSSRTVNSDVNTIIEEGTGVNANAHLHPSPIPSPSLHPPNSPMRNGSTSDAPRATLNLSQNERTRGVNVTSWGSYNP